MKINENKIKNNSITKILSVLAFGLASASILFFGNNHFLFKNMALANDEEVETEEIDREKLEKKVEEIDSKIDKNSEKLEELEQKSRNYQRIIDLKKQQQATLRNQIELMNVEIERAENSMRLTEEEIRLIEEEKSRLERELTEKERQTKLEKEKLENLIIFFNQIDRDLRLEFLLNNGDLTKTFTQAELLEQTSQEISKVLEKYKNQKKELENQKKELENQIQKLNKKKEELGEKKSHLSYEQKSKEIILRETLGEEARYQKLLERVERQKQELIGDIDSLSEEKRRELEKIQDSSAKPKSGLASTSWYYSQKDKRWGYNRIGLSSSLMKDYGCAVTSLSMVFTYHGEKITPGGLAAKPIFYRDLIVWPAYWGNLELVSSTAHGSISWKEIDKAIQNKNPVIVFVRVRAGKGHYVVIHNKDKKDYIVHDPLFGPNIYLGTTRKLVGAIYDQTSTMIDQVIIYKEK